MSIVLTEEQKQMVSTIREFVNRDVKPYVSELEHADEYPHKMVEKMKEMGLFGAVVPKEYGGLGLDNVTFALIIEELCKGWMSLSGNIGSHSIMTYAIVKFGTEEQKQRFLPQIVTGEKRGGIGLTEAGRRQRPAIHPDHGRERWRRLRDQWFQDVRHQRHPGQHLRPAHEDEPQRRAELPRHQPLHNRKRRRRLHCRQEDQEARVPGHRHHRVRLRRLPRAHNQPTGWGRGAGVQAHHVGVGGW